MVILREAVFDTLKLGESSLIGTYFQNVLAVKAIKVHNSPARKTILLLSWPALLLPVLAL